MMEHYWQMLMDLARECEDAPADKQLEMMLEANDAFFAGMYHPAHAAREKYIKDCFKDGDPIKAALSLLDLRPAHTRALEIAAFALRLQAGPAKEKA